MKNTYQKGAGAGVAIAVIAIVLIGAGFYVVSQDSNTAEESNGDAMIEQYDGAMTGGEDEGVEGGEEAQAADTDASSSGQAMEKKSGTYASYSPEAVSNAEGKVVLFFHANWCPTCRALDKSIESNLGDIPEGVTIFKTNYDTETKLKQKYGVTYQHTLVQIDAQGNKVTLWGGGNTLETILKKVQ